MAFHIRSPLARAIFEKMQHQNEHSDTSHKEWYSVNMKYLSSALAEKFVQFGQDVETQEFMENCFTKSDWLFTQIYHGLAKSLLTWFISATSANGLLNRGSMFVLSSTQIAELLQVPLDSPSPPFENLLDLGAGDGNITLKFRPFFRHLFATEMSSTMQWRLNQKGISLLGVDSWMERDGYYDVISCLNLLDRCDRPLSLLESIRTKLRPETGLLLLGLVVPVKQYVENNWPDHRARERLPLASTRIWEVQWNHFVREALEPAGFRVLRWSRVPYLCEGDFSRSFYLLNDVVAVLQPVPVPIEVVVQITETSVTPSPPPPPRDMPVV